MNDTKNIYLVQLADGTTFEAESPADIPQTDWFIDQYYKGTIVRLWINGVEFVEPTEQMSVGLAKLILSKGNNERQNRNANQRSRALADCYFATRQDCDL